MVKLEVKSLDLEATWRPCCEGLGLEFGQWDVMDGEGLLAAAAGPTALPGEEVPRIDLAVISYVFYHYMSNEACYDWLSKRIGDGEACHCYRHCHCHCPPAVLPPLHAAPLLLSTFRRSARSPLLSSPQLIFPLPSRRHHRVCSDHLSL